MNRIELIAIVSWLGIAAPAVGADSPATLRVPVAHEHALSWCLGYLEISADRIAYQQGDFVALAPQLPQADIVTLEKVICCYPDMRALVGLSSARAGKLYGVVFPRDTWWMRLGGLVVNLFPRLQRNAFRFFVHPTEAIESVVRANGLERHYYRKTLFWQVIVYTR